MSSYDYDIFDSLAIIGVSVPNRGSSTQIKCPFHGGGQESSPSCRVYPHTQTMHCFRCDKSWDAIDVIKEYFGYTFSEAVNFLSGNVEKRETASGSRTVPDLLTDYMKAISELKLSKQQRYLELKEFDKIVMKAMLSINSFEEIRLETEKWFRLLRAKSRVSAHSRPISGESLA
jgi:DNA primase